MTSSVLRRQITTFVPLILLIAGSAAGWQFPGTAIAPTLYFLAVLTTFQAQFRSLCLVVAAIGTVYLAAVLQFLRTVPTDTELVWLGGLWLAVWV